MWNYRIMKHKHPREDYYAVHEVYYDEEHKPRQWTKDPVEVMSDTAEGITEVLRMMLKDVEAPVLDYPEEGEVATVEGPKGPAEPGSV